MSQNRKVSQKTKLAQAAMAVWVAVAWMAWPAAGQASRPPAWGKPARKAAPDFRLASAGSSSVSLSQYKGKVVLLNFWATTCGGCKVEIPWFMELQDRYQNRGFTVIGVAMDDDGWKSVKPYLQRKPFNYPIVVGNENVARLYGGVAELPMTMLIDRDGAIAASYTGIVDKERCETQIRALLK